MTKYNTGNPVGSADPRDRHDNSQAFDQAINSDQTEFQDRLGKRRLTVQGMVDAATTGNPAVGAAQEALASADRAEGEANRSLSEADRAEAAKDAAQLSSGVYADTTAGLAATSIGDYFSTPSASESEYLILYRHDSGPVATLISAYPSAGVVRSIDERASTEPYAKNLVRMSLNDFLWAPAAGVTESVSGGIKVFTLMSALSRLERDIIPPASESTLNYRFALRSKTGGTGANSGRLSIIQYNSNDAPGSLDAASEITRDVIQFTDGSVASPIYFDGSVTIDPATVRIFVRFEAQDATDVTISEIAISYEPLSGYIKPSEAVSGQLTERNWPFVSDFSDALVDGVYLLSTLEKTPSRAWQITPEGKYRLIAGANVATPVGASYSTGTAWRYEISGSVDMDEPAAGGVIIGFGDTPQDFVGFVYLQNGYIGTILSDGSLSGGVAAGMSYAVGESAKLSISVDLDGPATLIAESPSGSTYSESIASIPEGRIWLCARIGDTILYDYFRAIPLSASDSATETRLSNLEAVYLPSFPIFIEYHLLPDSTPGRDPKGFTCTGLDKITRGIYAGCWVIGDDGRLRDDDGGSSPFDPAIHILTPDFRTIVKTISFPWNHSVQGVAVDTSGSDDTVWIAAKGDKNIYHYDLDGNEIVGDRFDWTAAGYSGDPNGLAYVPESDALWVSVVSDSSARLISCDPSASPRLLDTKTLSGTAPDQLHYRNGIIYYSVGGNGQDGTVRAYNVSNDEDQVAYGPLKNSQAIEGIYIDPDLSELFVVSDGGFHVAANPQLNIAIRYRCKV